MKAISEEDFYWIVVERLAKWGYCPGGSDIVRQLWNEGLAVPMPPTQLDNNEYAELALGARLKFEKMGHPVPRRIWPSDQ